tara:strand:- start:1280 stop:2203 length:924 start_codon:yes stop_codon:yes gene_type:complete
MANPTLTNTSYAGELALPYVHAAVVSAPTLHGGNVTLLDGIRYKAHIPVMSFGTGDDALIKAGACDFDETATSLLDEATLTVTDLMVNLQLCKKQFNTWWQGDAYSINSGVPDDYADAILLYVAKYVQADIEHNIWMGGATTSGYAAFDGFKKASGNTAGATELTKSIVDQAEVIEGLQEIISAMPAGLVGDFENTNIYVNPATISAYNLAIGQAGNGYDNAAANGGQTNFVGYKLVSAPGIASGEACLASKNNLFVGIGTADSDSLAQAIDMTPLDGSDNYRITMRYAVGTAIGVVADVVWFKNDA